jgi:hypothetical protein
VSGAATAGTAHVTGYTANALKQYTGRRSPGVAVARGVVHEAASLSVNGGEPTLLRSGERWLWERGVDNSEGAAWQGVEVVATRAGVGQGGVDVSTTRSEAYARLRKLLAIRELRVVRLGGSFRRWPAHGQAHMATSVVFQGIEQQAVSRHDYTLDALGRRSSVIREDGSQWSWEYNARDEVLAQISGVTSLIYRLVIVGRGRQRRTPTGRSGARKCEKPHREPACTRRTRLHAVASPYDCPLRHLQRPSKRAVSAAAGALLHRRAPACQS